MSRITRSTKLLHESRLDCRNDSFVLEKNRFANLGSEMRVTRAKNFIGDRIGDDTIVIDTDTGAYYSLTPEAGQIWSETETGEAQVDDRLVSVAVVLVRESILVSHVALDDDVALDASIGFTKVVDMADILLADPIHDVDEEGWPRIR